MLELYRMLLSEQPLVLVNYNQATLGRGRNL